MDATESKIEALKSLKDWSTWLVAIDAGALGLIGKVFEWNDPLAKIAAIIAAICLLLSLVAATFLVGVIPVFIQRVGDPSMQDEWWVECAKLESIYDFNQCGITVQVVAATQHFFFLLAAIAATIAIILQILGN